MATANIEESPSLLLEKNIAYFKDTLLQIQCHNFNWEYQKVPRIVANLLIGDLRRILKCAVFLKENRILLLTEELDLHSRYELHENLRRFINVGFECRNFHGDFTIAHVGHYPDLVSIAAHVIVDGLDQSVLEEDIVYDFPQFEPDVYRYLPLIPKAHSTPHDRMQELVHAIEGLDLDILQHVVGKAVLKHGLELIPAKPSGIQYHEQREPEHNLTHLDQEGVLQASQVMVQQLVEKGMLKGSIPKLDNFNGDPQSTKISFHVWEKQVMALEGDYTPASIRTAIRNSLKGRALQDISILPPDTDWKVLLETLRIKYQHKASYDSMLSVFYGLQMTSAEDCAAFSSKLEQKLSYVQAMYPEKLNTQQYWHLLRERFFHGLPVNLRTNIRNEYEKGIDYYPLLQAARMIESELKADSQFKTASKTELKGDKKPKFKGAAVSLIGADKELTHLEKAWSETANEMKAMQKTLQDITTCIGHLQQNRSPQPISPTNTVDPANPGNNNSQRGRGFYRGRGGRNRGRGQGFYQERPPICWWCKGNVSREEAQHRIQDCPIYKECRENWWRTHPTNSDTTIPSNPEQEEN